MTKTKTCLSVGVLLTACLLFSSNIVVAETETVWDRTYGMYGSGRQVIQTSDGGYAIAGVTDGQCLLLKTDSSGSREWTQTYGNGSFSSIVQTADEGYALAGSGDSINFVKTDSEGNIQWSRHYNNSGVPFHINSVIQTSEGGYALAGWTSENPYSLEWDWTVKTDSYGDIMWSKTFGLSRGNSLVQEILQAPDGGYVLAANQNISKLDSAGNIQWTNNAVIASSLTKTADGGYLLAAGNGGGLIKFDESGNREWNNVYRFEGAKWSFLHSVAQTGDGGYVLAGVTYPVYDGLGWVLKISENGTLEGEVSFPPERGINNSINSIIEADDGNYVFTGFKNAPDRTGLLWVAKVAPTTVIPEFPQWMPLLIMLVAVIAVAVIYRRRMSRRSQGSKIVKKSVSLLISLLLLISVVVSLPQIKTVKAAPVTIYIKEDGSIVGTDKIRQYGDTYRFIEDVNSGDSPYGISIERDNIVVDGAGYTLQGNFNTCQPNSGVSIYGVHIRASHITLRNLNIENYRDGIQQYSVSNNHFADNSITYCNIGIFFSSSPNNMLRSNKLENNGQHLKISVDNLAEYNNDIDQSNTVDGKPIIYWLRKSDSIIPPAAGLVFLINCTKMTIKNLHLSSSGQNILLDSTTNSTIQHNTLLGNGKYAGIHLRNSNNIQIIGNTIKNQSEGIHLHDSSNNHINQNQILNNAIGVEIRTSNNNEVSNNTFSKNGEGVYSTAFNVIWGEVTYSIGNTISNNTLTGNNNGISIEGENLVKGNVVTGNSGAAIKIDSQVTLVDNVVADNAYGIDVFGQDNVLKNNVLMNNAYNLFVSGIHKSYWRTDYVRVLVNDIDSSNTINGHPVYYWVSKKHERIPADAGYVMLVNCDNITVQNQNICSNGEGIVLLNTTNSRVFGNTVSDSVIGIGVFLSKHNMILENFIRNNDDGMRIGDSVNNTITFNNITLNNVWAINFKGSQTNNTIYYNNFIDNGSGNLQISIDKMAGLGLGNFWDNGTIGNYWSDYLQRYPNASTKSSDTLVGNTPFYINENNIDSYPLMEPLTIPEFPSWMILPLLLAVTLIAVTCKHKLTKHPSILGV